MWTFTRGYISQLNLAPSCLDNRGKTWKHRKTGAINPRQRSNLFTFSSPSNLKLIELTVWSCWCSPTRDSQLRHPQVYCATKTLSFLSQIIPFFLTSWQSWVQTFQNPQIHPAPKTPPPSVSMNWGSISKTRSKEKALMLISFLGSTCAPVRNL